MSFVYMTILDTCLYLINEHSEEFEAFKTVKHSRGRESNGHENNDSELDHQNFFMNFLFEI